MPRHGASAAHADTQSPRQLPPQHAPFDLTWSLTDTNGLPINPAWAWQLTHPLWDLPNADASGAQGGCDGFPALGPPADAFGVPPCTSQQPTLDGPGIPSPAALTCKVGRGLDAADRLKFPGHVNWFNATYTGRLYWEAHSSSWPFGDDDYNLRLAPQDDSGTFVPNGMTVGNIESSADTPALVDGRASLGLEFQASETIDHFGVGWWERLHEAVGKSDAGAAAMAMLGGRRGGLQAIVIGLVGMDSEHSPIHTEIHPVFVLAVHTSDSVANDTWAIFVRNWGNEGWCSHYQHYLNGSTISLFLPRSGAAGVSIAPGTLFRANIHGVSGPNVRLVPGRGAQVTFTLPPPTLQARAHGELHLHWLLRPAPPIARRVSSMAPPSLPTPRASGAPDAEERARQLAQGLSVRQRHSLVAAVQPASLAVDHIDVQPSTSVLFPMSAAPMRASTATRYTDDSVRARTELTMRATLCRAYHGRVPGYPTYCRP